MRIILYCTTATLLLVAGCAAPAPRGGSGAESVQETGAASGGHGESPAGDYRQVLSDPGPF